jgi:hypothetical protein
MGYSGGIMRSKIVLCFLVAILLILPMPESATADDDLSGASVTGTTDGRSSVKTKARLPETSTRSSGGGQPASGPPPKKITVRPSCAFAEAGADGKIAENCQMQQCANGKDQYIQVTEEGNQGVTGAEILCGLPESDPGSLAIDEFYKSTVKISLPSAAPPAVTLAQFPNIFWSDVKTYEEPTGITVADVRLKFLPVKYVWNFGDGKSMTTTGPGKPYDPALAKTTQDAEKNYKNIHRYGMTGTFNVTVTVVFNGQYSVNGGDWIDIAGSVQATSPSRPLTVYQARAELVKPKN